jgi:hypothetical protein
MSGIPGTTNALSWDHIIGLYKLEDAATAVVAHRVLLLDVIIFCLLLLQSCLLNRCTEMSYVYAYLARENAAAEGRGERIRQEYAEQQKRVIQHMEDEEQARGMARRRLQSTGLLDIMMDEGCSNACALTCAIPYVLIPAVHVISSYLPGFASPSSR